MATKFVGFDGLNGITSEWHNLIDMSLKFYDLGDFHRRLNEENLHPMT